MKVVTSSAEDTKQFAKKLAQQFKEGAVIALSGPLGAGKTTFTQGFALGLGIKERLISPTFILMRQYQIPNSESKLFHIDLYRFENTEQAEALGLEEIFNDSKNTVLIEWAEKLDNKLPKNTTYIQITPISETEREITIKV